MNKILRKYLCDFLLVLFHDILIYKKNLNAHVQHVDKALQLLRDHQSVDFSPGTSSERYSLTDSHAKLVSEPMSNDTFTF